MTDEEACVPVHVKQEAIENEAVQPKIELDEFDNVFIKEEDGNHETTKTEYLHSDFYNTKPTILGGSNTENIKEEQQAVSIKSDLTSFNEDVKEETDEIKCTESKVCDNSIKDAISCVEDNTKFKQEGSNGKTGFKRKHKLLITETVNNEATTSPKKRPRKQLSVEEKNTILNIFKVYMSSHPENTKVKNVKFTAEATGTCEASVYKILKEHKEKRVFSPPKQYNRPKAILDNITEEQKSTIRRIVHSIFLNNEPPTVANILNAVNEREDLPNLKKSTMRKLLKSLNFRYKGHSRYSILKEKDEIVNWRRRYLREIKNYMKEGRKIYYLGETWINAGHTVSKVWNDVTVLSARDTFIRGLSTGLKEPSGKGQGLIVLHIGADNGFVENGLLIFQSEKSVSCEYHEEKDSEVFEEWFRRILPNLEDGSVIVMDSACHHSRKMDEIPTSASTKLEIQDWLRSKNVAFEENMVKAELLVLVKQNKPTIEKYAVDELARANSKIILRLPPYHCELNPIESIWAQIKGEVAKKNTTFQVENVKALFYEALGDVTSQNWEKAIQHVAFFRDKLWEVDDLMDMQVEPLIVNLQGDSSSESDTE